MERNFYDFLSEAIFEDTENKNVKFEDTRENRAKLLKDLKKVKLDLKALKTRLNTELITAGICTSMVPYLNYQYQMVSANPNNPFDGFIRFCQIANVIGIVGHLVTMGYKLQDYAKVKCEYDNLKECNRQVLSGEAQEPKKAYDFKFINVVSKFNDEAEKEETKSGPTLILDDMLKARDERRRG